MPLELSGFLCPLLVHVLCCFPFPCLVASHKVLSSHPGKRRQVSALHPIQQEPVECGICPLSIEPQKTLCEPLEMF